MGLPALVLLPLALLAIACVMKFSVVLSLLGRALGGHALPSTVVTGMAILLAAFVLSPVVKEGDSAALAQSGDRVRAYLEAHTPLAERTTLVAMQKQLRAPADRDAVTDHDLGVMLPAYAIAGLEAAFRIGFFLLLPFLVLDLLVAIALLGLGMNGLEARVVSLPLKLLLFVSVDGWALLTHGLLGT